MSHRREPVCVADPIKALVVDLQRLQAAGATFSRIQIRVGVSGDGSALADAVPDWDETSHWPGGYRLEVEYERHHDEDAER